MTSDAVNKGIFRRVFAVPTVIALISGVGLVAALIGDNFFDVISWAGLGIPVMVIFWAMAKSRLVS